ncbi:MAG: branched-chain amino acid aminotransferase [Caldimicrobium sp.]|nr:branched-chain amino acid aminotransferase [Caldimicrobium sp.]MCX7613456.1 branched-chain amino acid aminotransferase [Caldimicrobium sp.]MDW8182972.1 branched-chain amino acid aminotransferase [Caldimicrobium sp.]
MEIEVHLCADKVKPPALDKLAFGKVFTPHMFIMDYEANRGWHSPRVIPFRKIELHPAAIVLHYSQTIFEGLKAYHGVDGKIRLFRPWDNIARLNRSAERLCIPKVDPDLALKALKTLIWIDRDWIPKEKGSALYIRPFIFGSEGALGVKPSSEYLFVIILCPVSAYYEEGFNPISIYVTDRYVRAFPGGTGDVKAGGNYAASLKAQEEAKTLGYTQILWLDAVERKYVEEVGTMNIFFYIEDKLVTPELTGSILPGITRDSLLKLATHLGLKAMERRISIDEVIEGAKSGALSECFGTGTAAVISPVGKIYYKGEEVLINNGETGPLAKRFFDYLTGLQYGEIDDEFQWTVVLEDPFRQSQ